MEVNCADENFSIVTVDPTFNLGEFYVTPVVFMQKKFIRKHMEQHPICLGLLLIHQIMNYSSYCYFATQQSFDQVCDMYMLLEQVENKHCMMLCWVHLLMHFP